MNCKLRTRTAHRDSQLFFDGALSQAVVGAGSPPLYDKRSTMHTIKSPKQLTVIKLSLAQFGTENFSRHFDAMLLSSLRVPIEFLGTYALLQLRTNFFESLSCNWLQFKLAFKCPGSAIECYVLVRFRTIDTLMSLIVDLGVVGGKEAGAAFILSMPPVFVWERLENLD